jgi:hypothetical protein
MEAVIQQKISFLPQFFLTMFHDQNHILSGRNTVRFKVWTKAVSEGSDGDRNMISVRQRSKVS